MIQVDYISAEGEIIKSIEIENNYTLNEMTPIINENNEKFSVPVIAFVGTQPAVKKLGDWDYPLENCHVQFRQVVTGGGGGSNPLSLLATLAITALAIAASFFVPAIPALGLVAGTPLFSFVGGLAGAFVMIGGNLLIGALFPQNVSTGQIDAYNAEAASPTYNINSSGNQARLYQPEPECFGRMRIVPDFVAYTWTEYINNEQYGYFVYGVGRGYYEIESMSFGETEFWRNGTQTEGSTYLTDDLQVEIVTPGNAVTLFPDNVVTSSEVQGQQLYGTNQEEYEGATGPYTVNPAGTTINKIALDFEFPAGLGFYDDDGSLAWYNVDWIGEYQKIDDNNDPIGDWMVLFEKTLVLATLTPQRMTFSFNVPDGRYRVRCRRTSISHNSSGRCLDTLQWTAMKGYLPGSYTYPITVIALYIKASNTLTGSASRDFSIICTRKLPVYNRTTKTWSGNVKTRSWAAAVSHVLKCEWGGQLKDSSIDLDTLWTIDEKLQKRGWYYDSYLDGPYLIWTLLNEMCQSQCVIMRFIGPVVSFVLDEPDRQPTFALTPRNISRDSLTVSYSTYDSETPDDVLVQYLDAEYGFQQRDVAAVLPESNSLEPTNLNILGITNRHHAFDVAVAYAAHNRWQRIVVECTVEGLGHIINKGDVCTISHPRFKNTQSGTVLRWNEETATIYLKSDTFESDINLAENSYLGLLRPDGTIWGPIKLSEVTQDRIEVAVYKVVLNLIDYSDLLLQGYDNPFNWLSDGKCCERTVWTLYTSKIYHRLMIVDEVKSNDLYHYNLKLYNYDSRIYQYNDLPVPAWQGRGQIASKETLLAPANVNFKVNSLTNITLSWTASAGATYYEIETSSDNISFSNMIVSTERVLTMNVAQGRIYVRVRASNNTMKSPWALIAVDTSLPISNPPILSASGYIGGYCTITWQAIDGATEYSIAVYHTNSDTPIYSMSAASNARKFEITPEILGDNIARDLIVEVRAINSSGVSSPRKLTLSDPYPAKIQSGSFETGIGYFTIKSLSPDVATDRTGFIIVRGPTQNFTTSEITEYALFDTFPFTWDGLQFEKYYFKIGVRDQFWEIKKQLDDLNYSDVFSITITRDLISTSIEAGV